MAKKHRHIWNPLTGGGHATSVIQHWAIRNLMREQGDRVVRINDTTSQMEWCFCGCLRAWLAGRRTPIIIHNVRE